MTSSRLACRCARTVLALLLISVSNIRPRAIGFNAKAS